MLSRRSFLLGAAALAVAGDSVIARRLLMGGGSGTVPARLWPPTDDSWTRYGSNPILVPTVGWEGGGLLEAMVRWEGGTDWRMWYSGSWVDAAIGYATSTDGLHWTKYAGNPVLGQGGSGYAGGLHESYVFKVGSTYWFHGSSGPPVVIATSSDGIAWTVQSSSVSLPSGCSNFGNRVVWQEGPDWLMLQEAYITAIPLWVTYLYSSADGLTWTIENGGNPLSTLQPGAGQMYGGPKFANIDGTVTPKWPDGLYHLWYHAGPEYAVLPYVVTDIYHATSPDLITWTITSPNPVLTHSGGTYEVDQVAGPVPLVVGSTAYLYFDGDDNGTASSWIQVATCAL